MAGRKIKKVLKLLKKKWDEAEEAVGGPMPSGWTPGVRRPFKSDASSDAYQGLKKKARKVSKSYKKKKEKEPRKNPKAKDLKKKK